MCKRCKRFKRFKMDLNKNRTGIFQPQNSRYSSDPVPIRSMRLIHDLYQSVSKIGKAFQYC